jgi:glycerol transport system substrate-binding protein
LGEGREETKNMTKSKGKTLRQTLLWGVAIASFALFAGTAKADMAAAKKWVDNEFQPSVLTKE